MSTEKRLSLWRRWLCAWRGHGGIRWLSNVDWQCKTCGAKVRLDGY